MSHKYLTMPIQNWNKTLPQLDMYYIQTLLLKIFIFCLILMIHVNLLLGSEQSEKKLIMVSDLYCPYACEADQEQQGYLVEFANIALKPIGYKVDYKVLPWKRVIQSANQGKVDAVIGIEQNDIKNLTLGDTALAKTCVSIVTRTDANFKFSRHSVFEGKRVGIINGYSYSESFSGWFSDQKNNNSIVRISGENALERLLKMINRNRIDATIADCNVVRHKIKNMNLSKELSIHTIGFESDLFIGIQKDHLDVKMINNAFDKAFSQMLMDGRLESLAKKYDISNWRP